MSKSMAIDGVLPNQIVDGGYCVGCGSCAFAFPDAFRMEIGDAGHWQAASIGNFPLEREQEFLNLCPMSGAGADENEIAAELYPDLTIDSSLGRYARTIAGHVTEGDFREVGGSGGMVSWVLAELLRKGEVDAVLHVVPTGGLDADRMLFRYAVSDNEEAIRAGSKSRYYPIEMSKVLQQIVENDNRYAIVGLPCFIKAVRLLERSGRIPVGRVAFCIGLVCGHLKSRYFADYLAWQKAIEPDLMVDFDFRKKLPERPASAYGFSAKWVDANTAKTDLAIYPMDSVDGRDWGEGLMKNPACEFCDDVLAECADAVIGDAWLPDYVDDWRGTNVAVIRDVRIANIVKVAEAEGRLSLTDISVEDIVKSQASGLRHRREGLAHRLARRLDAGIWAPRKRVVPRLAETKARRDIYDLRLKISEVSSTAFANARNAGSLLSFQKTMSPILSNYRRAIRSSLFIRAVGKGRRILFGFARAARKKLQERTVN